MRNIFNPASTAILIFFLLTELLFLSDISFALQFEVTNLNDAGAGSLRQAIIDANTNPGPDEIIFQDGLTGIITLITGEMAITDDLTITGPGADVITIDAVYSSRIFNIDDSDGMTSIPISISGLRLTRGNDPQGGAIYNAESLSVTSCILHQNIAFNGGAIGNVGTIVSITNSVFNANGGSNTGGAIENTGTIESITNSTFSGNTASNLGGAIQNNPAAIIENITNSTFTGNMADLGGAISNYPGSTIENITNSTLSGNSAFSIGGAISNIDGTINISFTTIANNDVGVFGGGIYTATVTTTANIINSILASNSSGNCAGALQPFDMGGNYSEDSSCGFAGSDASISLGPLADNGGPTQTMALLAGNPLDGATAACDALDSMGVPTGVPIGIDQRYFPRPFGPACDSGAYEAGPAAVNITKVTVPTGQTAQYSFTSTGFEGLANCDITPAFTLGDMETVGCVALEGDYTVSEVIPNDQVLNIFCPSLPELSAINSLTGVLSFTISEPDTPVNCLYINSFADTLVSASEEPPGANCEFGGVKIESGRDTNQNGVLDPDEVEETFYVCNGEDGTPGPPGPPGPPGTDINVEDEPPGINCEFGGLKIEVGTDTNQNGALDPDEVEETFYVCNGAPGGEGPPGPAGSNGSNCALAGSGSAKNGAAGLVLLILFPLMMILSRRVRKS